MNTQEPLANAVGAGRLTAATPLNLITAADIGLAIAAVGNAPANVQARYDVRTYVLKYLTQDGQGQQVEASALVALPLKNAGANSPVLAYQHGTITTDAEAPSKHAVAAEPAVVLAAQGYVVLAADYVGYGATKGTPHPYLLAVPSAAVVLDLLTAARYWQVTQHVASNQQLFMMGYSEGAYVTMAAQRALQAGSSVQRSQLVAVSTGAGPYDVQLTLDALLQTIKQANPVVGALVNPGFLRFLSSGVRQTVRDLLLAQVLGSGTDVVFQTTFLDNYLADDTAAVAAQSNVFDWLPQQMLWLFHGRADQTVAYGNATTTLQAMQARGAGALVSLTDCTANPAGHLPCVWPFWGFALQNFAPLARDL